MRRKPMFDDGRKMTVAGRHKLLRAVLHLRNRCTLAELEGGLLAWDDLNDADADLVIHLLIRREF